MAAFLRWSLDLGHRSRFLGLVLCGALASSCGDGPTSPNPADYQNVEWHLATLQRPDASTVNAPAGVSLTARFDDDGMLAVQADCNSCHAHYAVTGTALSVAPMACTLMLCPSAPLDSEFARVLSTATAVDLEDSGLVVRSPNGTLRFVR